MDLVVVDFYEEDGKDLDFYDFELLFIFFEDEENVFLVDIFFLWDCGFSEQEVWVVCLECSLFMWSVVYVVIFQSLCIMLDILVFNISGNVCFMEQFSDDFEGVFVFLEFDVIGNIFEVYIYFLGVILKVVFEYVVEFILEFRLS